MENKKPIIIGVVVLVMALTAWLLVGKFKDLKSGKNTNPPVVSESESDQEAISELAVPQKNMTYLTATVTEKRENELLVNGMITESSFGGEGKEEPRLITKDEKTKVVKILTSDYQKVSFSDIQKGDKISVGTFNDFKNNESVLALTISIYPASNK